MTKVIVLKSNDAESLAQIINAYFMRISGHDAKILSIVHDGKQYSAFINTEMTEPDNANVATKES